MLLFNIKSVLNSRQALFQSKSRYGTLPYSENMSFASKVSLKSIFKWYKEKVYGVRMSVIRTIISLTFICKKVIRYFEGWLMHTFAPYPKDTWTMDRDDKFFAIEEVVIHRR